jgi:hypothetical protein
VGGCARRGVEVWAGGVRGVRLRTLKIKNTERGAWIDVVAAQGSLRTTPACLLQGGSPSFTRRRRFRLLQFSVAVSQL